MKTLSALLASIMNAIGLINTVIDVTNQSVSNVGDAIIDTSEMVKAGVHTAKVSFDMENAKSLQLLEEELKSTPNTQSTQSTSRDTD